MERVNFLCLSTLFICISGFTYQIVTRLVWVEKELYYSSYVIGLFVTSNDNRMRLQKRVNS